jgi:hypothetical protein
MKNKPPLILDSAKVLKYAIVDSSVEFTGRLCLYVDGKLLGKVPKLAICQNYKEKDFLLFFCNKKWKVLGVAGYKSIKETKERAENAYKGISKKWVTVAKPNVFKNWPGNLGPICSFCGKTLFEGIEQLFRGNNAYICNKCINKLQRIMEEDKNKA